ncbi:MAG: branched-chain amino acid ABC transporter permease [Rhodobacteraceae bacterium]|nr:branched-chain amino acid ABC transporter permease [Paracoccaceae bacterium]
MSILPFVTSGLGIGAVYALAAVGMVLLYRTTGVLNLAFGAASAVGAFIAFEVEARGFGLGTGVILGILAATLVSSAYGRTIAPVLAYRDMVTRAVGTLGFALVLLGVMGIIWGEAPRRIQFPTDKLYVVLFEVRLTYTRIAALLLAILAVLALTALISRTRLGLNMRAIANNRDLSAILGVPVLKVEFFAWLITGVFAGLSGILMANLVGLKASALTFLVVPAIAAAIIGGMNSLPRTAAAGLFLGVAEAMLSAFPEIAPFRSAAPYVLALVAVAITPSLVSLRLRKPGKV